MSLRPARTLSALPRLVLPGALALAFSPAVSVALLGLPLMMASMDAQAQAPSRQQFDIPAGLLEDALNRFGRETGILLSSSAQSIAGLQSPGLKGLHTVRSGLDALLSGTGMQALPQANGTYQFRRQTGDTSTHAGATLSTVVVSATADTGPWNSPPPYAGGQLARGGRVGLLGNKDVMDTPFMTSNYTAEFIENQQARSLVDVLANDPSVVLGWPRDSYVDQYNVRGFSVIGEDTTYGGLFGVAPFGKMPLELVERVEVIKGMSGFLRGISPGGGLGASINMVPKRATDAPITRFTTSYDSTAHIGGHVDLGRRLGSQGEFGIRFNGVYRDGETLRRGSDKEMATAALALDYRSSSVRASLDVGFDKLNVKRGEYWYFLDSNQFAIPAAPDTRSNTSQMWNQVDSKQQYAMGRVELDLTPATTVYAAVGGSRYEIKAHLPEPILSNSAGDFTEYFQYRARDRDTFTGEIGVRSHFRTGSLEHAVTATATVFEQKTYNDRVFVGEVNSNLYQPTYVPEPAFFGSPAIAARFDNLALQSHARLSSIALADEVSIFDDRLILMAGVRRQGVDTANFAQGMHTAAYDKSRWTFGAGVIVKPIKRLSLYANYVEGLSQGPVAPTTATNAGEIFAPYKTKQYEAGVKYDLGNVLATVGVFQIARPNGHTDSASRIFSLNGEQRNRGLEASVAGMVAKGVRVMAGAMLLDARLTRTATGTLDGNRAAGSPRSNIRLGGEWDPAFVPGLTLSSRINRSSSQFIESTNLQSIPAWTTLDLGGRYTVSMADGKKLTLRADVRNLTNKAYWASAIGEWLNAGPGRTLSLSATLDF